jgi:hypothetical protein
MFDIKPMILNSGFRKRAAAADTVPRDERNDTSFRDTTKRLRVTSDI